MNANLKRLTREQVYKIQPALSQSLIRLGEAATSSLPKSLTHLIRIRVSQINGCAFCLSMHMQEARRDGEDQARLDVLSAWREAHCFDPQEKMALLLAETITNIGDQQLPDAVYADVAAVFSEQELVNLIACIIEINSWNRIAITFRF